MSHVSFDNGCKKKVYIFSEYVLRFTRRYNSDEENEPSRSISKCRW